MTTRAPWGELGALKAALRVVKGLCADTPATDFGPLALKAVREQMAKLGWSRPYCNAQAKRVRRMLKWATENELVPPGVWQGLADVAALRAGKTAVPETEPVKPVAEPHVAAVLPHVSRQVRAMIELQLATGMRPGEAVIMRGCDTDTGGPVWVYKAAAHKGISREVFLNARAQEVVRPFLRPDVAAHLFSPAEAERLAARHEARKTP